MARLDLSQLALALPDAKLDRHLEETYNMPTSQWWESVNRTFVLLQALVSTSKPSAVHENQDDPVDEYAARARSARAASLPFIHLFSSGTHALGLTATNENLPCVAFGTVGRARFVELLWESIADAQDDGVTKITVHEILQGEIPRITLRFNTHVFEMRYLQCEPLIRACPVILGATKAFLEDRNNCSAAVQEEVQRLQLTSMFKQRAVKDYPEYQKAYYYKRAWAVAWGLFDAERVTKDIFGLCDEVSLSGNKTFSPIVSHFLERWGNHYPQTLDYTSNNWDHLLSLIEAQPLSKRLDYPHYLQVTVLYTGPSSLEGGEWLSMVERKLPWLTTNLKALTSPVPVLGSVQRVRFWPRRLVRSQADPEDGVYEGCYVLGFDIKDSALWSAIEVAERWKLEVDNDNLTIKGQCFLNVISQGKTEIEKQGLKPCARIWPRPTLKPETGFNDSQSLRLSKREKRELAKEQKDHVVTETPAGVSKTTRKLRPASDVLGRLRHGGDYNIDEFVVGYKDRHSPKLLEKPVAKWARDSTDEDFIPEHRIEYFKRYDAEGKEELFWDKNLRLDKIFQHGGSE